MPSSAFVTAIPPKESTPCGDDADGRRVAASAAADAAGEPASPPTPRASTATVKWTITRKAIPTSAEAGVDPGPPSPQIEAEDAKEAEGGEEGEEGSTQNETESFLKCLNSC